MKFYVNRFPFDRLVSSVVKHVGAEGLGFDSRVGQIGHSVTNGSLVATTAMFLRSSAAQALSGGGGPRHSLHARA